MSAAERAALEAQIPRLAEFEYRITSPQDYRYNCFAWAGGDSTRVWSPTTMGSGVYWPPGIPALPSINGVMDAYRVLGYEPCESPALRAGYEKIAIYADQSQEPRHAARQLPSGCWASKLGDHFDIEHEDLAAISGLFYGEPAVFMRRYVGPARDAQDDPPRDAQDEARDDPPDSSGVETRVADVSD